MFLSSLPSSYDQLKHTLKYCKESITLEEVISAARSKQREINVSNKSDKGSATSIYTSDRGRSNRRESGDSRGGRSRSKSKQRKVMCWYFKKEEHVKKDCYARKRRMENEESDGETAVAIGEVDKMSALHTTVDEARDNWVIDSGCTHHMTCRRDWFVEFTEAGSSKILLGDYHSVETSGRGTIRLNTKEGSVKLMKDVRYVPTLRRNLISTSTLDRLGFTHSGGDGKISFYKNKKLALQGTLKNGLYIFDGDMVTPEVWQAEKAATQVSMWHSRLGHMSFRNLQVLVRNRVLSNEMWEKNCSVNIAW